MLQPLVLLCSRRGGRLTGEADRQRGFAGPAVGISAPTLAWLPPVAEVLNEKAEGGGSGSDQFGI